MSGLDDVTEEDAPPTKREGAGARPARPSGLLSRGTLVGRYVMLDVVGEGGMGVVYAAYDPELDRKVAIKLLQAKAGASSSSHHAWIVREAQALARLSHPNVVAVHDVGTLPGDRVFVAMELVDGVTLRAWLREPRTWREIVPVMRAAGAGLAAAHAAGLVHRDFKPANVIVGRDGRVRVMDFGLARQAGDSPRASDSAPLRSSPLSEDLTAAGSIVGTPAYIAPEIYAQEPADARSDQFSFGVALYEALYRMRPYDAHALIEGGEVKARQPPDVGVPAWLQRVVLRAISYDPSARFVSMEALLTELAVDPAVTRRRLAIAAGAIVLAGVLTWALWPRTEATCSGAGDRVSKIWNPARHDRMKAAFLASNRSHAAASFDTVVHRFEDWNRRWELGYVDACKATHVRGEQSEHVLDLRMQCLTRHLDEAGAMIEALSAGGADAVDHAIDAVMGLPTVAPCSDAAALTAAVPPPDTEAARARVQAVRAKLDEARAQDRLGRYAPARDLATAALAAARATEYPPVVADALIELGQVKVDLVDRTAIDDLREAMYVAARAGEAAAETRAAAWLVWALTEQTTRYDVALEIAKLAEATAEHARPSPEIVVRLDDARGLLDQARGKPADAQARFEQALAFAEKSFGPDDPSVLSTLTQLGNNLKIEGKFADARKMLERVLATRERIDGKDHPDVASALNNVGNVYRAEDKLDDAKRFQERALAIRLAALGPDHPDVATSYSNLGSLMSDQEDVAGALQFYEKALAIWVKAYGPDSVDVANARMNIGLTFEAQGKLAAARTELEQARKTFEAVKGPDAPDVAIALSNLGTVLKSQNKLDDALALYKRAEDIAIKAYGPNHPDVADYISNEATVYTSQNKLDLAQATTERALAVIAIAYGPDHTHMAMGLSNLGNVQSARDDHQGALASYQKALAIFEANLGKDHPYVAYPLLGVGTALTDLKRPTEGLPYLERALQIRTKAAVPPALLAEVHFELAEALAGSPSTHARAVAEARTSLALYVQATDAENAAKAKTWLAKHQ